MADKTTIINNPPSQNQSRGSGGGWAAVTIIIVAILLFFLFGLPRIRGSWSTNSTNSPGVSQLPTNNSSNGRRY